MVHVQDNDFEAHLKVFKQSGAGAPLDGVITMSVFRTVDDSLLTTFTMSLDSIETPPLGNACFTPPESIEIGYYTETITLPDLAGGYYLAWERCCLSTTTQNIVDATTTGMLLTARIPDPELENSSPVFDDFPAEGYFCVGIENSFSFGATDADGDSLVYSFVTPLDGAITNFDAPINNGPSTPSPFLEVIWEAGFSATDFLGSSAVEIDSETGLITGQATEIGQYIFAVKVEEWREGVLLGEVRREFNIFSTTNCAVDNPPTIVSVDPMAGNTEDGVDSLTIMAFTSINIPLLVIDDPADSLSTWIASDIFTEGVYDVTATLSADTTSAVIGSWSGIISWDSLGCEMIRDEPYLVYIISEGKSHCPPFEVTYDSLTIALFVVIPEDIPTRYEQPTELYIPVTDEPYCIDIVTTEDNHFDTLTVSLTSEDILVSHPLDIMEMTLPSFADTAAYYAGPNSSTPSPIVTTQEFCWQPECGQIRAAPYVFDFRHTTRNCDLITDTILPLDVYVYSLSDGLLDTVPNVMTLNEDGLNDTWRIGYSPDICIANERVLIYDRWGRELLSAPTLGLVWDGRVNDNLVSDGTYFYLITYTFLGEPRRYTGTMSVMR